MTEPQRILHAAKFSYHGLKAAIKEPAFRSEMIVFPFIIWGAYLWGDNKIETLLMIGCWVVVLIVEIINTAIEATVDRIGTEHHELSGLAKDLGSAAVFISMALAVLTWIVILI